MANPKTMFGLNSKKLASLLKLGSRPHDGAPSSVSDQGRSDLLRDRLAERLPCEQLAVGGVVRKVVRSASEKPLQDHLLSRKTDVSLLRRIKEHGASLSLSAQSAAERQVANVIYYAAIASGLLFHSKKLTEYPHEKLSKSFSTLAALAWITPSLKTHFQEAARMCETLATGQMKETRPNG